jgi:hypothetical protein
MRARTKTRLILIGYLAIVALGFSTLAGAADAVDLASCVTVPDGVAAWQPTATITHLEVGPNGFHIDFDKKDSWPDVVPPGWDGPIRWTVWLGAVVNGRCHLAASLNVWHRDDSYGGPVSDPAHYPKNLWYLDGGLAGYTPQAGETIYLMLTAGAERGLVAFKVAERSQVVSFPLGAGSWSFTKPLPPSPPVVTPPQPPAPLLPSTDWSPLLNQLAVNHAALMAQFAEVRAEIAVVGQKVDDFREAARSKIAAVLNSPIARMLYAALAGFLLHQQVAK